SPALHFEAIYPPDADIWVAGFCKYKDDASETCSVRGEAYLARSHPGHSLGTVNLRDVITGEIGGWQNLFGGRSNISWLSCTTTKDYELQLYSVTFEKATGSPFVPQPKSCVGFVRYFDRVTEGQSGQRLVGQYCEAPGTGPVKSATVERTLSAIAVR